MIEIYNSIDDSSDLKEFWRHVAFSVDKIDTYNKYQLHILESHTALWIFGG